MQSSGTRCPLIEAAPQRPRNAALGADAGAPLASGTVSPGIAGTVIPPMVTQPLAGAGAGAGATEGALPVPAAFSAGTVKPGIAGSTKPPKFTQPGGAETVASEVTRVGGAKAGVGGAAAIATGAGG